MKPLQDIGVRLRIRRVLRGFVFLSIPILPFTLGVAGLIPFWALGLGLVFHNTLGLNGVLLDRALATYAALIVSFLGGIRWGLAAPAEGGGVHFVGSVVPTLLAWALLAAPEPWRLGGLAAIAMLLGPIDLNLVSTGLAPRWLGRLRLILSTGAGAALVLGAIGIS